jgi:hypothetical protein
MLAVLLLSRLISHDQNLIAVIIAVKDKSTSTLLSVSPISRPASGIAIDKSGIKDLSAGQEGHQRSRLGAAEETGKRTFHL